MDDYGVTPEWREAWQWANCFINPTLSQLADLAAHLLAGWMRERFEREHYEKSCWQTAFCASRCGDPRHNFTDADWERVAREELGK